MRFTFEALSVLACVLTLANPAHSQPRFYVGGGIISDHDRTNSSLTEGAAASWSLVGGIDLTPHTGLRVVFEAPRQATQVFENVYLRPPSPFPSQEKLTRSQRTMTYAVMADVHAAINRRVRWAITYGLAQVTHDIETLVVRREVRPEGTAPLPDLRQVFDHDWVGLTFGAEVPIVVTTRVEIVPEVRMIYFVPSDSPDPYITRAGVGMRWRF